MMRIKCVCIHTYTRLGQIVLLRKYLHVNFSELEFGPTVTFLCFITFKILLAHGAVCTVRI